MMLRVNEGDYSYASGVIRAKEPRLLGNSQFARMLDSPSAEDAFKVLTEAGYGFGAGNNAGIFAFEKLLADEMKKCFTLLSELAPKAEVIRAFQRRYDYFNIKVLLKAEFAGADVPAILTDTGTISGDEMRRMIRERDYGGFTEQMAEAVEEVYDVFSRTNDPQAIDMIMDKASYRQFAADLRDIDSPFLWKIAEIVTDMTNIKMFVRARSLNKSWDFIKKLLLDGGTIPEDVYFKNSDRTAEDFAEDIRNTKYAEAVKNGLELKRSGKNSSGLEKKLDDLLMGFIRSAKLVTIGVEPLIAYLFAKEAEIRNVRIIMTGKINGLPVDMIRERLREVYV
jgi:V/A-type H+-transporting ATPase subunit C